jgi:hypothetical protein
MLTVWQWTGRYNCAVRTGCVDCIAVLVANAEDPAAMAQAFRERGRPPPGEDDLMLVEE